MPIDKDWHKKLGRIIELLGPLSDEDTRKNEKWYVEREIGHRQCLFAKKMEDANEKELPTHENYPSECEIPADELSALNEDDAIERRVLVRLANPYLRGGWVFCEVDPHLYVTLRITKCFYKQIHCRVPSTVGVSGSPPPACASVALSVATKSTRALRHKPPTLSHGLVWARFLDRMLRYKRDDADSALFMQDLNEIRRSCVDLCESEVFEEITRSLDSSSSDSNVTFQRVATMLDSERVYNDMQFRAAVFDAAPIVMQGLEQRIVSPKEIGLSRRSSRETVADFEGRMRDQELEIDALRKQLFFSQYASTQKSISTSSYPYFFLSSAIGV